jgi:hypothetical protein
MTILRNLAATCAILFGLTLAVLVILPALRGHFRWNWDHLMMVLALAAGVAVFLGSSVRFVSLVLAVTIVRSFEFFRLGLLGLLTGRLHVPPFLLLAVLGAVICPVIGLAAALAADPLWRKRAQGEAAAKAL